MNPEKQRVTIAVACGVVPMGWFGIIGPDGEDIPDYLNDLNAAMQFVEHLRERGVRFQFTNYGVTRWDVMALSVGAFHGQGASLPALICEVGLKTLGQWDESEADGGK